MSCSRISNSIAPASRQARSSRLRIISDSRSAEPSIELQDLLLLVGDRSDRAVEHQAEGLLDRGERRLELVRDHGDEVPLQLLDLLEPIGHRVEFRRQGRELVRPGRRHPIGEITAAQGVGSALQPTETPGDRAHDEDRRADRREDADDRGQKGDLYFDEGSVIPSRERCRVMRRSNQSGQGKVGLIIAILVVGVMAYLGVKIIPVRVSGLRVQGHLARGVPLRCRAQQ